MKCYFYVFFQPNKVCEREFHAKDTINAPSFEIYIFKMSVCQSKYDTHKLFCEILFGSVIKNNLPVTLYSTQIICAFSYILYSMLHFDIPCRLWWPCSFFDCDPQTHILSCAAAHRSSMPNHWANDHCLGTRPTRHPREISSLHSRCVGAECKDTATLFSRHSLGMQI